MARLSLWDRLWLWWENICPEHMKPKCWWTGYTFPGITKECLDCRVRRIQRQAYYNVDVERRRNVRLDAIRAKNRATPKEGDERTQ